LTRAPTSEIVKRNTLNKGTVITVGSLALIAGAVGAAFAIDSQVSNKAQAEVQRHCDRDIDRAHSDLPRRYVTKSELKDAMHNVDTRLTGIEKTLQDKLPNLKRWFDLGVVPMPRRRGRRHVIPTR
jgi:hypothetical protein